MNSECGGSKGGHVYYLVAEVIRSVIEADSPEAALRKWWLWLDNQNEGELRILDCYSPHVFPLIRGGTLHRASQPENLVLHDPQVVAKRIRKAKGE